MLLLTSILDILRSRSGREDTGSEPAKGGSNLGPFPLEPLLDTMQVGFTVTDLEGTIIYTNRAEAEMHGYEPSDLVGKDVRVFAPEDRCDPMSPEEVDQAAHWSRESINVRRDGTRFPVFLTSDVIRSDDGRPLGVLTTSREITEEKEAERHRDFLMRELDHRVQNCLATTRAIFERTVVDADGSLDDLASAFRERLAALARVHRLLAGDRWQQTSVTSVVEGVVRPYVDDGGLELEGPEVRLHSRIALPLSMGLHELAVNAVKHGTLHEAGGELAVRWSRDPDGDLTLVWDEGEGEPVPPPEQEDRGFGITLLQEGLPYEIGGEVEMEFLSRGLRCTFRVPLDEATGGDPVPAPTEELR